MVIFRRALFQLCELVVSQMCHSGVYGIIIDGFGKLFKFFKNSAYKVVDLQLCSVLKIVLCKSLTWLMISVISESPGSPRLLRCPYGGTILRKQRKKRKSENISKIGIFGNLDLISQNSEFDCVDSFWFRKVDLLFCEIISKPRNPRIWCNLRKWIASK